MAAKTATTSPGPVFGNELVEVLGEFVVGV